MDYGKKEMIAYCLNSVLPLMLFFSLIFLRITTWQIAITISLGLCIITYLLGTMVIATDPLLVILKKKALMAIKIDSSGVLKTYIAVVKMPYVSVKSVNGWATRIFDRRLLTPFLNPKIVDAIDEKDFISLRIPKEDYSKNVWGWNGLNVFLWSDKLDTFITKETLANQENKILVDHAILQLNERVQTLFNNAGQIFRFFMDKALRKDIFNRMNWLILIIVAIIIILAIVFNKPILDFLTNATGGIAGGAGKVTTAIRTPIT